MRTEFKVCRASHANMPTLTDALMTAGCMAEPLEKALMTAGVSTLPALLRECKMEMADDGAPELVFSSKVSIALEQEFVEHDAGSDRSSELVRGTSSGSAGPHELRKGAPEVLGSVVLSLVASSGVVALDAYREAVGHRKCWSEAGSLPMRTGCAQLDSLLDGGFCRGRITEVFGTSGSGKTQLVTSVVCCLLADSFSPEEDYSACPRAIFIDSGHGFSPHRCANLIANPNIDPRAMSDVHVLSAVRVLDVHHLHAFFAALEGIIELAEEYPGHLQLLVVDSITAFIAPHLKKGYSGQAAIESASSLLRRISRSYGIAVVVTNRAVAKWDESGNTSGKKSLKPALGHTWGFVADHRFMIGSGKSNDAGNSEAIHLIVSSNGVSCSA